MMDGPSVWKYGLALTLYFLYFLNNTLLLSESLIPWVSEDLLCFIVRNSPYQFNSECSFPKMITI